MKKNILVFVMSPFAEKNEIKKYCDGKDFTANCVHTNETALKYLSWKLGKESEKIDKIYAFVSEDVRNNHLKKFKDLFSDSSFVFNEVELPNNGDLQGSFIAISKMFDVLKTDLKDDLGKAVIHVDMTGGPRHSSMLMLALLNMLTYYRAKIGCVIYTNFQKGLVEDAKDIIDMFTLMSGTQEFISYGSVEQIKKYFSDGKEITIGMKILLERMEGVSEALKICASLLEVQDELRNLNSTIAMYKQSMAKEKKGTVGEQELFFSKLLSSIELEYGDILPQNNKPSDAVAIIRWCLNRGFLQQAITLYTEWMPVYLIENEIIKIHDATIKEVCIDKKAKWDIWEKYFIKLYVHDVEMKKSRTFAEILKIVTQGNANFSVTELTKFVDNKNENLSKFFKEVEKLDREIGKERFTKHMIALPQDNVMRHIMQSICPSNNEFAAFLDTRIKRVGVPSSVVLKALGSLSIKKINELLKLDDINQGDNSKETDNIAERIEMFKQMRIQKLISFSVPDKKLYSFVESYLKCVADWRNKFNHAAGKAGGKIGNEAIKETILESLKCLN